MVAGVVGGPVCLPTPVPAESARGHTAGCRWRAGFIKGDRNVAPPWGECGEGLDVPVGVAEFGFEVVVGLGAEGEAAGGLEVACVFLSEAAQAMIGCTTSPATSVRRKSRPAYRYVRRS